MDALAPADMLLFEGFRLDRRRGCLLKQDEDGAWRPVTVGSRALDALSVLADRQGTLLSKEEIMAAAWPKTVVEDNNLAVQISALRRILDRGRTNGSCIQTVVGRGYRFVASVTRVGADERSAIPTAGHLPRATDLRGPACRSWCCPLPTSATTPNSNISRTGSPRM
jgi:DNA-binding winged helix-turn-helix (wHTH) protein